MASSEGSARQELEAKLGQYDYVRFSFPDINGVCRGKVVPGHVAHHFLDGLGFYSGIIGFAAQDEIPLKTMKAVGEKKHGNAMMCAELESLHDIPWAAPTPDARYKVAELYGDIYWDKARTKPYLASPRYVAKQQLLKLDQMGYSLYSGYEVECNIYDRETGVKPNVEGISFCSNTAVGKIDEFLFSVEQGLRKAGVTIGGITTEYNPGQVEFSTQPETGIRAADLGFLAKVGIKEMAYNHGYIANFMGKPLYTGLGSGLHYSHSVWKKDEGVNLFHDADGKKVMSELGRHWLGGLMAHTDALTALTSPTINCYRRFHGAFSPNKNDWGIDDRMATYRVKAISPADTYIENRLPSAACNPYIVLAATLAAGMDGIKNKIEPPPEGVTSNSADVVYSLQEALAALRADKVMAEALGDEFVTWYIEMKEEIDLVKMGSHNVKEVIEEELVLERKRYEDKI